MTDDKTAIGDWTDDDVRDAATYGCCNECGRPRRAVLERRADGVTYHDLRCDAGHSISI